MRDNPVKKPLIWAQKYADLELPIFRIHGVKNYVSPETEGPADDGETLCWCACGAPGCTAPGKHPIEKGGYKNGKPDASGFRPGDNIGLATGKMSGIVVVDLDVKPNQQIDGVSEALDKRLELPETVTQYTGSGHGGKQLFYEYPPDAESKGIRKIKSVNGVFPGVDVKADGGYVILPESRHISGQRYAWADQLAIDSTLLAPCPAWVIEKLGEKKPKRRPSKNRKKAVPEHREELPEPAEALYVRLAKEFAGRAKPGNRNSTGFDLARCCRDVHGMSQEEAETVGEVYQGLVDTQQDPYTLPENKQSVAQAYKRERVTPWRFTEVGFMERFIQKHGADVRFVYHKARTGDWYRWTAGVWRKDTTGEISRWARVIAQEVYGDVVGETDKEEEAALLGFARLCARNVTIRNMLELASAERGFDPAKFNTRPDKLITPDGAILLQTGENTPAIRTDYSTQQCGASPDPLGTECKEWLSFLERIFNGDQSLIDYVQRALGYSFTGHTSEQCFFICHGTGANGKSTLLETVAAIAGDYAQTASMSAFMQRKGEENYDLATLEDARFVVASEGREGQRLNSALVKNATGEDRIKIRHPYERPREITPKWKIWLSSNYKPSIPGTDYALARRVRYLPFTAEIPENEQDPKLKKKLLREASGILRWILDGAVEWYRDGLQEPSTVLDATAEYLEEHDPLKDFLDTCFVLGENYTVSAGDLHSTWKQYCERTGEYLLNPRMLGIRLKERRDCKLRNHKSTGGARYWRGLKLRSEYSPDAGSVPWGEKNSGASGA